MEDGRVVSNFILQSLQNKDVTVYGDGSQTRSFQYVDDLVDGLIGLMNSGNKSYTSFKMFQGPVFCIFQKLLFSDITSPVNIGNPEEHTISEFADLIIKLTSSQSRIVHMPAAQVLVYSKIIPKYFQDDPQRRKPDISKALEGFGWKPRMALLDGLQKTVDYFKNELAQEKTKTPNIYLPEI